MLPRERRGANDRRGRKRLKGGVGLRLIIRMWRNEDGGLGLWGRACGNSRGRRMRFDDPHSDQVRKHDSVQIDLMKLPVGFGGNKLGNRMRKRLLWAHMKDRERVLTVIHTTGGEDHGNEMNTGVFE